MFTNLLIINFVLVATRAGPIHRDNTLNGLYQDYMNSHQDGEKDLKYFYSGGNMDEDLDLFVTPVHHSRTDFNVVDDDYQLPINYEYQHPGSLASSRIRRQAQGTLSLNGDGSTGLSGKVPLTGNDKYSLSALGNLAFDNKMNTASKGIGLALDTAGGHGASVMKETLPGSGSRLTGAGHANLFHNDNHDVTANAFISRTMPSVPNVPNFNTVGGGVDYMYKNKVGASLGMANTPFLHQKEYSAMGNLNLFRNPTTSVDFGAGFKKFETPSFNSGWNPSFGFTLGKTFGNF